MRYKTRVWHPFMKDNYHWAWHEKFVIGILQEFGRDLRRCHERIWRGYCDNDIFSICDWFLGIMPMMLQDFCDHQNGCPIALDCKPQRVFSNVEEADNPDMDTWKDILNQMITLLQDADEETCSKLNPYQAEFDKMSAKFEEKYGPWGEKLMTDEEREADRNGKGRRIYTLNDIDEYRPIADKYFEEQQQIDDYRRECKDKALELFSKWFYALWD